MLAHGSRGMSQGVSGNAGQGFRLALLELLGTTIMLFYVALAVACFIAAAVGLWLIRSVMEIGKEAYRAILPSRRENTSRARLAHLNPHLKDTPSPWGWSGSGGARHANLHRSAARRPSHPAPANDPKKKVPWGWPGSEGLQRSNRDHIAAGLETSTAMASVKGFLHRESGSEPDVGWPYRQESSTKRRPRRRARHVNIGGGKPAKPWGW